MLDWDDLRHFLAVHRSGTLARAGAELGINATTVGRRLTALEERVQARLFDRTPDGYVLTTTGRDLLPRAERIEEETLAIERDVLGADSRLAGTVRVTATEMLATRFIMPHLPAFHARCPDVTLGLECTTHSVSLARREADIALRLARPREENVVARPLTNIPLALYASHGYVEHRGVPKAPDTTLTGHEVLLFADSRAFTFENDWFSQRLGEARIALRSDSVSSIYSATLAGLGIALLPVAVAERDPALRRIRTSTAPEPRVIWQAVYADVHKSARVRAVLDFLGEILAAGAHLVPDM
ncbi:MAG TPA: LysR family transcriptional regulator [Polyangiaceae bacterium]|jgi:DNA-binding transcriptional LysR family regulator|nr:LysR family transcriptional regulator [Polyangiaceae bacterium]